ncbi:hypothetical protein CA51_17470 [Rosistilla oblonga]|uniref:hypothetical protein n=1 Tax=Rosistilla oblonga TaxID=2527990 RepID=UPI001187F9A3|nr:hypothetical protein CA51_17470 [Rosistilla oblonga]
MTDSQKDLVLHLLQQGNWHDAVVACCEETGADVETARAAVRQLASEHRLTQPRNWWLIAVTMLMTSVLAVYVLI